jgi:hypothetical protein
VIGFFDPLGLRFLHALGGVLRQTRLVTLLSECKMHTKELLRCPCPGTMAADVAGNCRPESGFFPRVKIYAQCLSAARIGFPQKQYQARVAKAKRPLNRDVSSGIFKLKPISLERASV